MTAVAEVDRNSDSGSGPRAEARVAEAGSLAEVPTAEAGSLADTCAAPAVREEQLLDVLYELLAQGVPERSSLTREQIERFLHEHARQPKPLEELLHFFKRHSLPLDASAYGADSELVELASGLLRQRSSMVEALIVPEEVAEIPVHAVHVSSFGSLPEVPAVALVEARGSAREQNVESEPTGRHRVQVEEDDAEVPSVARLRRLVWVGVCAALALLAAFSYSQWQARLLANKLDHAHMQQLSTDAALTKLEQRAERLSGQLEHSEDERRGLSAQFDAVLKEEASKRASEEEALQRLLGARYRKLRQKVAEEATVAAP